MYDRLFNLIINQQTDEYNEVSFTKKLYISEHELYEIDALRGTLFTQMRTSSLTGFGAKLFSDNSCD